MPMQRNLYPPDWPQIALRLKVAARWQCQRCGARRGEMQHNRHGDLAPVQIQVMHLDHDPWNRYARLEVACQKCHITYDARDGRRKRVMMQIARGQLLLPGLDAWYRSPQRTLRNNARSASSQVRHRAIRVRSQRGSGRRKEVVRA